MYLIIKSQDRLSVGNCAKNYLCGRQCIVSKKALNNNDCLASINSGINSPFIQFMNGNSSYKDISSSSAGFTTSSTSYTMTTSFGWLIHRVRIIYLSGTFNIASLLPSRTPTQCQREIQNKNNFIDKYSLMVNSPTHFFAAPFLPLFPDRPQFIVQKYHRFYSILRGVFFWHSASVYFWTDSSCSVSLSSILLRHNLTAAANWFYLSHGMAGRRSGEEHEQHRQPSNDPEQNSGSKGDGCGNRETVTVSE